MEHYSTAVRSFKVDVETPLSCLAMNNDANQVVVAGRNVVQVYCVENYLWPSNFTCRAKSVYSGRPTKGGPHYNSNISDVAWSINDQSKLATASTNGSITIWNLSKQLTEQVTLMAHTRSAHKVLFSSDDPNLVLSASQDGTVKFFDMRSYGSANNPTIARQLQTAKNRVSPVRDVQYCPKNCYSLAVANDNGELQLWDTRNLKKYFTSITCHTGSIMSIDWHPNINHDGCNWLATAGCRDHLVKVWEINPAKQTESICSVKTSNVNRICWRKEEFQLASSSNLSIDLSIHVWDIQRPYIPFASFEGHSDLVTGIQWSQDKNAFFSVGKDGLLIRHNFTDAEHIVNSITPIATDISPNGRFASAARKDGVYRKTVKNVAPDSGQIQPNYSLKPNKSSLTLLQKFSLVKSELCYYNLMPQDDWDMEMTAFIKFANRYKLYGESVRNVCLHNSEVAASGGDVFLTNLWMMLSVVYGSEYNGSSSNSDIQSPGSCSKLKDGTPYSASHHRLDIEKGLGSDPAAGRMVGVTDSDTNRDKSRPDVSTGNSDENSDSQNEEPVSKSADIYLKLFIDPMKFLFDEDINCMVKDLEQENDLVQESISNYSIDADNEYHVRGNEEDVNLPDAVGVYDNQRMLVDCAECNFSQYQSANTVNSSGYYQQQHQHQHQHQAHSKHSHQQQQHQAHSKHNHHHQQQHQLNNQPPINSQQYHNNHINHVHQQNQHNYFSDHQQQQQQQQQQQNQHYLVSEVNNAANLSAGTGTSKNVWPIEQQQQKTFYLEESKPESTPALIESVDYIDSDGDALSPFCTTKFAKFKKDELAVLSTDHGPIDLKVCESNFKHMISSAFDEPVMQIPNSSLFEFLQDLVDQDCLQTVCTVVIVLKSQLALSEFTSFQVSVLEMWFQTYINLLVRYRLWSIACLVIKLCPCPEVASASQKSTTVATKCGKCDRVLDKHGATCLRHPTRLQSIQCSVCRLRVQGEYLWCHACGHGGHFAHLTTWFQTRQFCPAGCGHKCQH